MIEALTPKLAIVAAGMFALVLEGADLAGVITAAIAAVAALLGKLAADRSQKNESLTHALQEEIRRVSQQNSELRERIDHIEDEVDSHRTEAADLRIWGRRLKAQLEDAGLEPVATEPA